LIPRSGIKIARILGIDIVINPTWLLIFVLVGYSLGETLRTPYEDFTVIGGKMFPGGPWPWIAGFITAAVIFACLLAHELSHSYVAKRNGISINRITLFIFGGVAEMGEDVTDAKVELKMALAGPLMTFLLAGVFFGLYGLAFWGVGPVLAAPLLLVALFNAFVGVFNLLPGFPLDGGRVLRSILWKATGDLRRATRVASIGGYLVAAGLVAVGVVETFVYFLSGQASSDQVLVIPPGLWLVLIGVFLFTLSRASYKQTLLRLAASDARVGDVMYTGVPMVDAHTTLTDLHNNYFPAYELPVLPVADNGRIIGTVNTMDLSGVAPSEWDVLNAGRITRPLSPDQMVTSDTPLERVLRSILTRQEFLLVVDGFEVKGILTRKALMQYMDARVKLESRR
jgi:Zn-dependent protease/predicted transcriptional regulator